MKKRILSVLIIAMLLTSTLFGCSQPNLEYADIDFATNASLIRVNNLNDTWISFDLLLTSNKKMNEMKVVDMDCEEEGLSLINFEQNIVESFSNELSDYTYKGLYAKYFLIEFKPVDETIKECTINSITLDVDGVERVVEFKEPLHNNFASGATYYEELMFELLQSSFCSDVINNYDDEYIAENRFTASEDLSIDNIEFYDYLNISDLKYSVNSSAYKKVEFPINLKKDDHITITFVPTSDEFNDKYTINTNLLIDFTLKDSGEHKQNSFFKSFDALDAITNNDMSIFDNLIDAMI